MESETDLSIKPASLISSDTLIEPDRNDEFIDEEALIQDILSKHTKWKTEHEKIKTEIEYGKRKLNVVEKDNTNAEGLEEEDKKLMDALDVMRRLDDILSQKVMIENSFKEQRLGLDSTASVCEEKVETVELTSNTEDLRDDQSMKSVHSLQTRTFITEPKFSNSRTHSEFKVPKESFITRNIALGGEARYFDALTPDEKVRVDNILNKQEDDNMNNGMLSAGYVPEAKDLERLEKVDCSLKELVGSTEEIEVEKFAVNILERDVEAVMLDVEALKGPSKFLKSELDQLRIIDNKIKLLMETDDGEISVTAEQVTNLVEECLLIPSIANKFF